MTDLTGKTALVTGGSKGIGLGIAREMVRAGLNVGITARNAQEVEAAARQLSEEGPGRAIGIRCDVRDLQQQEEAVRRLVDEFGGVYAVIANAGVGAFGPIDEFPVEEWHKIIDTNLTGVFYTVKASVAELKRSNGYLITIGSLAGVNFNAGSAAYNASKWGITGFSQAIMLDLRKHGIKVSTIMPGSVSTYFRDNVPSEADTWKIQPEDIGEMVMYLLRAPQRTLPSKVEVRPSRPPSS
ncbi:MAG TPA: SDR family oxidoreductase [Trueperaceae bacterium]